VPTSAPTQPHNLLLGVCGGIAAYKAAELASQAQKVGFRVRVVMTPSATRFVGPLTFEGLTGHPVMVDALATGASPDGASAVEHISWAKWADLACIAPLTASTLGRLACGLADDALSTVFMALPARVPTLLCPAMNTAMWDHPVVRRNVSWLDALGRYEWVEPVSKRLACGDVGVGALAEVGDIVAALVARRDALGRTVE
jgi:phosphopantothenoylcysteine decarboxylase/phosphopantothenate--cysteine ligase